MRNLITMILVLWILPIYAMELYLSLNGSDVNKGEKEELLAASGLKQGDIILAINGQKVMLKAQF